MSINLATEAISSLPQLPPTDQAGSYSTLSMCRPANGPSLISTSFLQATGQAWQVGSLTKTCSLTYSPLIDSARSPKEVSWLLRVEYPPMLLVMLVNTLVP